MFATNLLYILYIKYMLLIFLFLLLLTIFNKGAYLTFKSIVHMALNLF